jgi:hypothetical protein
MSKSNKYVRGKIYKIICNTTGLVYIGSTCKPRLCQRLASHVSNYKSFIAGNYHYVTSFKIIENGDYQILLLEEYPCSSKDQLKVVEAKHIRELDSCVNKNIPGRTMKEYNEDNKDHLKEYRREYREANKDNIKKNKGEYYEQNKERLCQINYCGCGSEYTTGYKLRHEKTKKHQEYLQGNWIYIWK